MSNITTVTKQATLKRGRWLALSQPKLRLSWSERRILLGTIDLLLLNGALIFAMVIWKQLPLELASWLAVSKWLTTLSIIWLAVAVALDLYDLARSGSTIQSINGVLITVLATGLLYLAVPWLTPLWGRRVVVLTFFVSAFIALTWWRSFYARVLSQPHFHRRTLVVGGGKAASRLAIELKRASTHAHPNPYRGTGYHVVDCIETLPTQPEPGTDASYVFIRYVRALDVEEILVSDTDSYSTTLQEALLDCRELGIRVTPLSVAYERLSTRLPVEYAEHDLSLIANRVDGAGERLFWATKRLMDIAGALVGTLVMLALIPFILLINAVSAPGPLFYRQVRVGRGGRPFMVLKFRTMRPNAEQHGQAQWAAPTDDRVTRLGRWLRRTHLDELPQVLNVLRGEMSIVGPRPERPPFVGQISRVLPIYRARHAVRPGITGWAQIRYRYGNSVEDARQKLEYDLYYVKHASLFMDFMIMLQTATEMLKVRGY